jgi:UDP-glucose 4-epimerase
MSERVLLDTSAANPDFKVVILRYFNVAGAALNGKIGQRFPNATHLIKVACEVATGKRDKIMIFGDDYPTADGTGVRDYIHVEDLGRAHLAALEYLQNGGKTDIFNCGYGKGFSVNEVINATRKVANHPIPSEVVPRRDGDVATVIADNSKILKTLNWKPQNDNLELICKSAYEWEQKI